MSITDEQHWSEALAHLRVGLRHLQALDCGEVSPHDVAELELLIGRVRYQTPTVATKEAAERVSVRGSEPKKGGDE